MSVFRRHGLARIAGVLRRNAWQAVPTVIGIVALNFVLLELVPGDAADVIAAESGSATGKAWRSCGATSGWTCRCWNGCGAT